MPCYSRVAVANTSSALCSFLYKLLQGYHEMGVTYRPLAPIKIFLIPAPPQRKRKASLQSRVHGRDKWENAFIFPLVKVLPIAKLRTLYVSLTRLHMHKSSPFCNSVGHSVSVRITAPLRLHSLQRQTSGTASIYGLKLPAAHNS